MTAIKLVIGLGNPGKQYECTRHNAGFMVLDGLARELGATWKDWSGEAELAVSEKDNLKIALLKPAGFMNNSGIAVSKYVSYFKIDLNDSLVVFDDFSLELGKLRLRQNGSAGGHNGVDSIIECTGTDVFPRLKLGIGPVPERMDPADFVLSNFTGEERKVADGMLLKAQEASISFLVEGFDKAASKLSLT